MEILKRGDKNDDVVILQHLLNTEGYKISVDGDFGPRTETVVKMFQEAHAKECGEPDGVVGPKTWRALGVKSAVDSRQVDPAVLYCPLERCITRTTNRTIKYLAIHYTAGASSAPGRAKGMKAGWEKSRRASADFGCDDRDMVQFNPDPRNYRCWSVGDKKNPYSGGGSLYRIATNSNTISIEMCSNLKKGANASKANHEGWYFTEATLNNAVKLSKILMRKFNIPLERVVMHYTISGKVCPGVPGWTKAPLNDINGNKIGKNSDGSEWLKFKKRLEE